MNNHIAKLQTTATNPSTDSEVRDKALARLKQISIDGNDKRHAEAGRVLRELIGQAPNATPFNEESDRPGAATAVSDDWGSFGDLDATPAPETKINGRLKDLIARCEQADAKSDIYRYWLPAIYREFVKGRPYGVGDLSRTAAEEAMNRYLPFKWMSRPLFEEIHDAFTMGARKSYVEEYRATQERAAALVPKWKRIKYQWEVANGPTRENICDLLYSGDDFVPAPQRAVL